MTTRRARARFDSTGNQVVDVIVRRGYRPDSIRARAGVPLRLVFRREDEDVCSQRVVFSDPRLEHRLSETGVTTVDLPALPPGEIRFTCGMGRYRGRIEIAGDRRERTVTGNPNARRRTWWLRRTRTPLPAGDAT